MLKRRLLINSGGTVTKLSPPQINLSPGHYTPNPRIVLTNPNPSGSSIIKYTLDGTEPSDSNGTTYLGTIRIYNPGNVLYAVCVPSSSSYLMSDVVGGEYTVSEKPLVAPKISPPSGTYTTSINVEIVNQNDPNTNTGVYYSIGKYSDPINNGTPYTSPITLSTSGDYCVKGFCMDNSVPSSVSEVIIANYTLDIEEPTIPEPFRSSSLIVRMYLTNDGPSQIFSSSFDYSDPILQDTSLFISDGTNGEIIEYNNYSRIVIPQNWDGTYTVPLTGFYFVVITFTGEYIPSNLFKNTSIIDIEYISPRITKIGNPTSSLTNECNFNAQNVERGAFSRCNSLETIILDSVKHTNYSLNSGEGLKAIGAGSFYDSSHVLEVSLPDHITHICAYAFRNINMYEKSLREITLPEDLMYIGHCAFGYCFYIQDFHLERCNSLLGIFSNAFICDISLATVTIPESVTTIGDTAFSLYSNESDITGFDCCRLVEVINKSSINLSPNTQHPSGIGKFCLSYKTSGSSDLNPRILTGDGYKMLTVNSTKYLVHLIPTIPPDPSLQPNIVFPTASVVGSYILNTAALSKPVNNIEGETVFTGLEINNAITEIKPYALENYWGEIKNIFILPDVDSAPTIYPTTFSWLGYRGTLHAWYQTTGVSQWMSNEPHYLGYYHWTLNTYGP